MIYIHIYNILFLYALVPHASAVDFTPSPSWREPNIVGSPEQRIDIASAALEVAIGQLNSDAQFNGASYGSTGTLYAQMADFDIATNQTKYKDQLKFYFSTVKKARSSFEDEFVSVYKFFVKLPSYTYHCSLAQLRPRADVNNQHLNGLGSGSLLILSAALAEVMTDNQTYLEAASQSIDFISNRLSNPRVQGIVQDSLWQGHDGVIKTKGLELVRALAAVYNRNSMPSDMQSYIMNYLGVQYNAVTELATEKETNVYGASWLGPPSSNFSASNQTAALSALIAAIFLPNDTNVPDPSSSTSPTATGTMTPDSKPSKNSGKIIGGAVGGISFVLIVGIILFLLLRKKRHQMRRFRRSMPFNPNVGSREQSVRTKGSHAHSVHTSTRQTDSDSNYLNSVQPPRWNREKRSGRGPELQRRQPSSSHSHSDVSAPDRNREASLDRPPRNIEDLRNNMTTAELVTILNERLQYGQWREDEMPPEYPESSRG
ncbi:hypothetical protein VKT23_016977 [Stygiomarasmius scandens]|uniref:Glycoside hydrolase family 76 protein n=1 Tax=Marasmiellus scandens TaxID=2682957 RepID=A0ABR1IXT6_9AGAR